MKVYFFLLSLLLAGCSSLPGADPQDMHSSPQSVKSLDTHKLNSQIDYAMGKEMMWPYSPVMVALHLFGNDQEVRSISLSETKNRGEGADQATLIYVQDGLLDDSVRGQWYKLDLYKQADGSWRVHRAETAFRCWRGGDSKIFQADLCP